MGNHKSRSKKKNQVKEEEGILSSSYNVRSWDNTQQNRYPIPVLPSKCQAWDIVYSGNAEGFRPHAVKYGMEDSLAICNAFRCTQMALCTEKFHAKTINLRRLNIERNGRLAACVPWTADKSLMRMSMKYDNRYRPIVVSVDNQNKLIVVALKRNLSMGKHIMLLDLTLKTILFVLEPWEDSFVFLHASFSPDSTTLGVLYLSLPNKMDFMFYMYSTETGKRLHSMSMYTSMPFPAPTFVFDPQYRHSRVTFASNVLTRGLTMHLIEVYCMDQRKVIKSMEFASPHSRETFVEPTHLVYSQDGQFLIVQTIDRTSMTSYNYVFSSEDLQLLKFLKFHLPFTQNYCQLNYLPVFSRCCSIMRVFDQCPASPSTGLTREMGNSVPTLKIYKLPCKIDLGMYCRRTILQSVKCLQDVDELPLPEAAKSFLKCDPFHD